MPISVEFFGIVRARAGMEATVSEGETLGEVLTDLATRFPTLADTCIDKGTLKAGFMANLGGARFVTDPETRLNAEDTLLILSMDAGG